MSIKIQNSSLLAIACTTALSLAGCGKSGETPINKDTSPSADAAKSLTEKAADTAKDVAAKSADAAKAVAAVATNTVAAISDPFNDGLASAKKLIAEKNFPGALTELNKLSSLKLTDEQAKVVDGLKADVQAMISKASGGATDAVKGLLGK